MLIWKVCKSEHALFNIAALVVHPKLYSGIWFKLEERRRNSRYRSLPYDLKEFAAAHLKILGDRCIKNVDVTEAANLSGLAIGVFRDWTCNAVGEGFQSVGTEFSSLGSKPFGLFSAWHTCLQRFDSRKRFP
jgi:hypothetical protein